MTDSHPSNGLVGKLRYAAECIRETRVTIGPSANGSLYDAAADEIERLRCEVEQFVLTLRKIRVADEPSATQRLLGAAQARVRHYEAALRKIIAGRNSLTQSNIAHDALYSDSPAEPPSVSTDDAYEIIDQALETLMAHAERHHRKAERNNSDYWAASHRERADKSDRLVDRACAWLKSVETARGAPTKRACQHDKTKPDPTLVPLGSAAVDSNDWLWMCTVCNDRIRMPIATAHETKVAPWVCNYIDCRQLNSYWAGDCGRCGRKRNTQSEGAS